MNKFLEPATVADLLHSRAQTDPDRLAYVEGDARLTFAQLEEQASALGAAQHESGVRGGDRVVLSMTAGLDFVRAFWAVQLLGATSCAMNPATPAATIVRRAARVRPALLITDSEEVAREAAAAALPCVIFRDIPRAARALPPNPARGHDIAVLQPTSGTSGESRVAMIRHRNVITSLFSADEVFQFGTHDVFAAWVPPWHDLGLMRFVIGAVAFGARTHIVQPAIQTIPEWLRTIARERATVTGAPDFAWRLAARFVDPRSVDLTSLRVATNGGEPVRRGTIETFEQTYNVPGALLPGYGLAEATLGVTGHRPGAPLRVDAHGNVACGPAMPNVELRIDADGEILIRGPVVFAGYLDGEEVNGWYPTGDIGHLDDDGHLYVLGRKRAMLKRGGAILAPRELEEAAQQIAGVKIAAAVGVPTSDGTEEIVVAIEIAADADASRITAEATQSIRDAVGFAPERVIVLEKGAIPRTYNGKLRHDALREALAERRRPGG